MEEFRREYEYDEETGVAGFLLIFLITLLSFDFVVVIIILIQSKNVYSELADFLVTPFLGIFGVYLLFKVAFVISLFTKREAVVKLAKFFLLTRGILFSVCIISLYIFLLLNPSVDAMDMSKMETTWQLTFRMLLTPLLYTVLFSVGWTIYFKRSARVRDRYSA